MQKDSHIEVGEKLAFEKATKYNDILRDNFKWKFRDNLIVAVIFPVDFLHVYFREYILPKKKKLYSAREVS